MTRQDKLHGDYFEWLLDLVCSKDTLSRTSYRKLLMHLHTIDFRVLLERDQNRADDGVVMRYRYAISVSNDSNVIGSITDALAGPCSVFEMMVALAVHCEEDIMDDPAIGDRTGQWFWRMVVNLGLGTMVDERYNAEKVDEVIERLLNRDYDPDGRGGLFRVRNAPRDLRDVEIYWQMCWYLNTIS